jgi:hypothetical protein
MPEYRKPPLQKPNRAEPAALDSDSLPFSIETTTMRLKSLKLRRAEIAENANREAAPKRDEPAQRPVDRPASSRPSGRVRHDERGMAVWDWAVATGEFATLSATNVLQKLDPGTLAIEETQRSKKAIAPLGKDQGGGGDPYNTRGAGQRVGDAARRQGVTGSADRPRSAVLDQLTGKKK